jgi:hypothetical protein
VSVALGFVIVVEHGDLEAKTTLLVESIRRVESLNDAPIFVVQPRRGEPVSARTLALLNRHDVEYIFTNLNSTWRTHGPMNKVYASALVEPYVEDHVDTLVFLDSDVLMVAPPVNLPLREGQVAGVTPIAQQRTGKVGQPAGEPVDDYWRVIYDACGGNGVPDWSVTTTIDRQQILPYFNSGVVAVRPEFGICRTWQDNIERVAKDPRMQPFLTGREFFFLDQTMLAGTLTAELSQQQIRIQDHVYNYPLPAHNLLPVGVRAARLDDLSIIHYHAAFSNLYWMDEIDVSDALRSWLLERLPLRPKFRMKRSAILELTSYWLSRLPGRPVHHRLVARVPRLRGTLPATELDAAV